MITSHPCAVGSEPRRGTRQKPEGRRGNAATLAGFGGDRGFPFPRSDQHLLCFNLLPQQQERSGMPVIILGSSYNPILLQKISKSLCTRARERARQRIQPPQKPYKPQHGHRTVLLAPEGTSAIKTPQTGSKRLPDAKEATRNNPDGFSKHSTTQIRRLNNSVSTQ